MNIRVLLVEPDAADAMFVQDVLQEMSAGDFWLGWVTFETVHAAAWEEATSVLANDGIDIILLAPGPADGGLLERFRSLEALAPAIPIVLLAASEDRELAVSLLREGAQDVLVKKDMDCGPLAHAMRHALERQRYVEAVRAASMLDQLTGLMNREAFLMLAGRDRNLAERNGQKLLVMAAEPDALVQSRVPGARSDLALIEASDFLRGLIGPADLVGRISTTRFGLAILDNGIEPVERAWMRVYAAARQRRIGVGGAILDPRHPAPLERLVGEAELDLIRLRPEAATGAFPLTRGASGN